MIEFRKGDIFESGTAAIVNPVNCVGVMGAGLAMKVKQKYPTVFAQYKAICDNKTFHPGHILPITTVGRTKWIINFATKDHYKDPSQIAFIQKGLYGLRGFLRYSEIESIAIPALGCGLGGLNWKEVRPLIVNYLEPISNSCKILIYEPL